MNQIRTVSSQGLELVVELRGEGHPIVFSHGLTGTRQSIFKQLTPLSPPYQIISFDQRGHGESSPVTDPSLYDPALMAEDLRAVLDALEIDSIIIGGESMGATTSLVFALKYPERVKTLLLTSPSLPLDPERARFNLIAEGLETLGMEGFLERAAHRQRTELGWSPEAIAAVAANFRAHQPLSIATACREVMKWTTLSDLSKLHDFRVPVCLIGWPGDSLHALKVAQHMSEAFPEAHLELLESLDEAFSHPTRIGEIYRRHLEKIRG